MQYVGEKDYIKRLMVVWEKAAIKYFDGDMSVSARQHVESPDLQIRPLRLQDGGDESIAAANVKHARSARGKLSKPARQGRYPPTQHKLFV
jgi:hypothetical protein